MAILDWIEDVLYDIKIEAENRKIDEERRKFEASLEKEQERRLNRRIYIISFNIDNNLLNLYKDTGLIYYDNNKPSFIKTYVELPSRNNNIEFYDLILCKRIKFKRDKLRTTIISKNICIYKDYEEKILAAREIYDHNKKVKQEIKQKVFATSRDIQVNQCISNLNTIKDAILLNSDLKIAVIEFCKIRTFNSQFLKEVLNTQLSKNDKLVVDIQRKMNNLNLESILIYNDVSTIDKLIDSYKRFSKKYGSDSIKQE